MCHFHDIDATDWTERAERGESDPAAEMELPEMEEPEIEKPELEESAIETPEIADD